MQDGSGISSLPSLAQMHPVSQDLFLHVFRTKTPDATVIQATQGMSDSLLYRLTLSNSVRTCRLLSSIYSADFIEPKCRIYIGSYYTVLTSPNNQTQTGNKALFGQKYSISNKPSWLCPISQIAFHHVVCNNSTAGPANVLFWTQEMMMTASIMQSYQKGNEVSLVSHLTGVSVSHL